jgi:hypothetical protein
MSISAVSSTSTTTQLVKLATGEYTAASVAADPKDALKLGLVREKDGNYGTTPPAPAAASSQSSSKVLSVLSSLNLGGD